jgi:protein tyrosine phosphatase (PTP) superfamily phosphohydrolase (DUF442 family)
MVVVFSLALLSLEFAGCANCGYRERSACDPVVEREHFLRRMGRRLFGPREALLAPGAPGCCGSAVAEPIVPVTPLAPAPAAVVPAPSVMAVPAVPGGPSAIAVPQGRAVVPAPAQPDNGTPELEEIPRGATNGRGPAPPASGVQPQGRAGVVDRNNYQTLRTPNPPRVSQAEGLARVNMDATTGPARRPARTGPAPAGSVAHLLDNLPPLGAAPPTVTDEGRPPAPIDGAELRAKLDANPPPTDGMGASLELPVQADDAPETAVVGIRHFRTLDTGVAGGSLPSTDGLVWLFDKGYRTVVDLRDPADVAQAEVNTMNRLGLRHVRVPIDPRRLDPGSIARFEAAITDARNRPVFFFDSDGNRAGLTWYLHRTLTDKVAADLASREAEKIGLTDVRLLIHASEYLRRVRGASNDRDVTALRADTPPGLGAAPGGPSGDPTFSDPALEPPAEARSLDGRLNWNPYAAPVAALLCVPLAYWGRTTLVNMGARVLASLPAPVRSLRSLPRA